MRTTRPDPSVHRLDLGYFIRPAAEVGAGDPTSDPASDPASDSGPDSSPAEPRVEPVLAYLVRHEDGLILFDTGIGAVDPETEAHYRPRRRPLQAALASRGAAIQDVTLAVNCHLHFDHCGGNPLLAGKPIIVQAAELATARQGGYTIDELVDFPGAAYTELVGEEEILPGVWIIPTPGHTDGHQSLVIEKNDGTVILAGQAHDFASHYASAHRARRAAQEGVEDPLPTYRPWLDRLSEFDPRRVLFAHDCSVWEPA